MSGQKKKSMLCPLCGEYHEVAESTVNATAFIKGQPVEYPETSFLCENCDEEENTFIPAKQMDKNLLAARNSYRRRNHLLTSDEIIAIRAKYGLTQRELSKLLGWGEATITRYETKLIQDGTHDDILRVISENALTAKEYLHKNAALFTEARFSEISQRIEAEIASGSPLYLTGKLLQAKYSGFQNNAALTGGTKLNIEKFCAMADFFAAGCRVLYKNRLMNYLWYTDTACFRSSGHSISGLIYQRLPVGAMPVGHNELTSLLPHEEEYLQPEYTACRILPGGHRDQSLLTPKEAEVLNATLRNFSPLTENELSAHLLNDPAYKSTADRAYIPYTRPADFRL